MPKLVALVSTALVIGAVVVVVAACGGKTTEQESGPHLLRLEADGGDGGLPCVEYGAGSSRCTESFDVYPSLAACSGTTDGTISPDVCTMLCGTTAAACVPGEGSDKEVVCVATTNECKQCYIYRTGGSSDGCESGFQVEPSLAACGSADPPSPADCARICGAPDRCVVDGTQDTGSLFHSIGIECIHTTPVCQSVWGGR
jgi:hypothetical protein